MFKKIRKWYENKTFSKKIFFSYLLFCIIPFFIATLITSALFINILFDRTTSTISDSNEKISNLMLNKLSQCEYVVNNLVCDPTFLNIVQESENIMTAYEINNYLNDQMTEMQVAVPEIKEFTIFSNVLHENDAFRSLSDVAQDRNLSAAITRQYATWYSEKGNIYAAYPIHDMYSGVSLGLIALRFDMQDMVSDYTELSHEEYGVYMFGPDSDIIYSRENFSFEIGKVTEKMLKKSEDRFFTAGKFFICDHTEIPNYSINLYCIVPEDTIYKPIRNYLMIPVIVWIICLLLVIALCLFMSRSLSKRVRLLESQMNRFSNGDLTVFEAEDIEDEIGNISRFCSQALERLNQLINDNYISQIKLQDAQNKALVAQINPHFLYNTLNMIAGQAIISGNTVITDVIVQLSNYYRTTLNKGKNLISVEDEIMNVKAYCNLQQRLHDYRFAIEYDIDKSVYTYTTINLCLQPLVENAIEHGVNNLPEGEGIIHISAHNTGDDIVFSIINNGAPEIDADPNTFLQKATKGYGLKNIQDRISIVFGEEYGLKLSSSNGVFTATLKIPTRLTNKYIEGLENTDSDV